MDVDVDFLCDEIKQLEKLLILSCAYIEGQLDVKNQVCVTECYPPKIVWDWWVKKKKELEEKERVRSESKKEAKKMTYLFESLLLKKGE